MTVPKGKHSVNINDFYMGKYVVTQEQWQLIMGAAITQLHNEKGNKYPIYGAGDNYPMYYVSWDDAQEFISRLNKATGKKYRLPTEEEWEYAARGGNKSQGYKYSGSNNKNAVAWHKGNSQNTSHPVGKKQPNELGIYDMSGNVWEWCHNWKGVNLVARGGSWYFTSRSSEVSRQYIFPVTRRAAYLGFRLALSP